MRRRTPARSRGVAGGTLEASAGRHPGIRTGSLAPLLRMLPPYVAVLVLWNWQRDAWACILAYHVSILVFSRWDLLRVQVGWNPRLFLLVALPCIAIGPVAYVMLPLVQQLPVGTWLANHGLAGARLLWMVPYFGIVHPILEQAHWSSLRLSRRWGTLAHVAFAGYHALVLASLMRPAWVVVCCGVVALASMGWWRLERAAHGGLAVPVLSHVLVDSGLVLAAVLRVG